uniref:Serine/threonine-protein kinase Nek11 n=1 Tax=Capra hircus TaxID=9925 RepID=A0A8C2RBI7_CAPHI
MLKFQEAAKCVSGSIAVSTCPKSLIARRYMLQQKLGSGSFGTVYLVSDKKAKQGEELKVLKEICIGELNPNETVQATLEAQLLSRLNHPAIVKFHANFVEQDKFCIITEYCEVRLCFCRKYVDFGITFIDESIISCHFLRKSKLYHFILILILHRDLKSKNIFLKNNKLKIGDFGVSRLLMGSCDLATTLTGTPHYMSPEVLKHQEDIYSSFRFFDCVFRSLACILYEMCCMNHAFTGSNFLSIVLKIVEGDTPSLPERYPRQLNAIMESMLNKCPSLRPSAIEILKLPYIDEQLQDLMCRYSEMALEDKNLNSQEEAAYIINAVHKKIHLQTLRALSEVQKMTPRERMRVRKVQAADEEARKLKKLVEEKYEENNKRMQELRARNFQRQTVDVLHEFDDPASDNLPESQPIPSLDLRTLGSNVEDTIADLGDHGMNLHQCSEGCSWMTEHFSTFTPQRNKSLLCLEHVLGCTTLDTWTVTSSAPDTPSEPTIFNSATARTRMKHMRESAVQKLGAEVFEEVYSYLKRARQQGASEAEVWAALETVVPRASDCFEVDQLLYFEEQLLITRAEGVGLPQNHHEATVRSKRVPVDKAPVKIHQHCR